MEEVQCTLARDDHANMQITCSARDSAISEASSITASAVAAAALDSKLHPQLRVSREISRGRRSFGENRRDSLTLELARLRTLTQFQLGGILSNEALEAKVAKPDLMTFGKCTVWAEYFNNMRKCWEPLLEKLVATVIYEKVCFELTNITHMFCL